MNKKFLFNTVLFAGAMMFAACDYNEDNFDGLTDGYVPSDVKKVAYTLTPADYQAVSKNKKNLAGLDTIAAKDSAAYEIMKAQLANVGKYNCFNEYITADKYLAPVLAEKYYMADNGSAVKVSYEKELAQSDEMKALNCAKTYKVSNEDYENIWGAAFNFFSPVETAAKHVPAILAKNFADAQEGDAVFVDYKVSDSEPAGAVVAINEVFDNYWDEKGTYTAEVTGWMNVITKGKYAWNGKLFKGNNYIQASAHNHIGEMETYMISPRITVIDGMHFSFDACYGHYKEAGGRLSVWLLEATESISDYTPEQIASAKWIDITEGLNIAIPETPYGTLANVYDRDLSEFAGKKVYLAFRYNGEMEEKDGKPTLEATTTIQLDNVVVKSEGSGDGENVTYPLASTYVFNGTAWEANSKVYTMVKADFDAMGNSHDNFSSSMKADDYLPLFLKNKYPYAQEKDEQTVVYKYFSNKKTTVRADEYVFVEGAWVKPSKTETLTDQFVLNAGEWKFDPSTTIVLSPVANELSTHFFQTATDWVWENIDKAQLGLEKQGAGYVSKYGNNEYYSGCSAYRWNVDFLPRHARDQYAKEYSDMSDEEIVALMTTRLQEVLMHTLEILYPEAAPVAGIKEVVYTIKFGVYTGVSLTDCTHEIKYRVVAPGKFEYIENSFQPLAK